jgi:hypothetical protein
MITIARFEYRYSTTFAMFLLPGTCPELKEQLKIWISGPEMFTITFFNKDIERFLKSGVLLSCKQFTVENSSS